jgi:molecular chaperone GrpE (heat shock protein)
MVEPDMTQELAALRDLVAALPAAIEKLDRQVARAGKEQFKVNSLLDTQQQNWKAILDQLRDGETARDREVAGLRDQLDHAHAAARLDLIEQVLPVLDGLDEAINAGEVLLADDSHAWSFGQRVRLAWRMLRADPATLTAAWRSAEWAAWLHGLDFVRERLLTVLAVAGVQPIEAADAMFDPHWHQVIETVAATDDQPAGSIVQETRRGYVTHERVLRYAEVVVAK